MGKVDYKSAGVNIDAGNEAVNRIKDGVKFPQFSSDDGFCPYAIYALNHNWIFIIV